MATLPTSPCTLCPRSCQALRAEGQRGVCGASNTPELARAALHFWEEPPISGTTGSGTVFFSHCSLHCVYCQNAPISTYGVGWEVSGEQLAAIFLDLQAQGAMNINLVTPSHYAVPIKEALLLAKDQGLTLPVVWNSSGYEWVETLEAMEGLVDIYLVDYKYGDQALAARYSKAPDYSVVALAAIEAMVDQRGNPQFDIFAGNKRMVSGVLVRHLLLPEALESSKAALSQVFERFGNHVLYAIMSQYTPPASELSDYPELNSVPSREDYEALLDFADALGLEDYFWQEGEAALESFIPCWDGEGLPSSR